MLLERTCQTTAKKSIQIAQSFLANSFELRTPLGVDLEKDDEKLVEITDNNSRALSLLGKRRRVAIAGCAALAKRC